MAMHPFRKLLASATTLLIAGCVAGIDVGGKGGGSTTTADGGPLSASWCVSPSMLRCEWGTLGGPCGGGAPGSTDCQDNFTCVGSSPGTPGTCLNTGDPSVRLVGPGDVCGPNIYAGPVCPWNYECHLPPPDEPTANCIPRTCILEDVPPLASAASITVDGDGPTQHEDFACTHVWGDQLTGEANAFIGDRPAGKPDVFWIVGCAADTGDATKGSMILQVPLAGVGTAAPQFVRYLSSDGTAYDGFTPASVTVTELSSTLVKGTYDVTVLQFDPPAAQKHLTGTFEVCRVPDP
jgi:hypothetical protein